MSTKKYVQKFRESWLQREELKDWLVENPNVGSNPKYGGYCIYCCTALPSKLYDLQSHAASRKHCRNVSEKSQIESVEVRQSALNLPDICPQVTKNNGKRTAVKDLPLDEKEDIFGQYIASELKLIKNQRIYEEVKWEILDILQKALGSQSDSEEIFPL